MSIRFSPAGGDRRPIAASRLAGIARLAALVAVVIAVAVALALTIGGQGPRHEFIRYLAAVQALALSSDGVGAALGNTIETTVAKRAALVSTLQGDAAQEQRSFDQAQLLRPPGPLLTVHAEIVDVLELRTQGLVGLGNAIATDASKHSVDRATVAALLAQAQVLAASDVVWEQLYRLPAAEVLRAQRVTGLTVPASRFVASPAALAAPAFVRLLQRLNGVTPSTAVAPILKLGSTGAAVKAWQQMLARWFRTQSNAATLPTSGVYDSQTEAATRAVQQAAGVTVDGTVGPATRLAP